MTAICKGFRTRADLRMRPPRSISYNINPAAGGCAVHWEGPHMGITTTTPHAVCEDRWRTIQTYHMVRQGWVDVAYTGGYCQHGYALAGRGFGVRTAANGTDTANGGNYAFCFLGGVGDVPTQDALNALEWWVSEARRAGKAGSRVRPHAAFFSTACPGPTLKAAAGTLDTRVIVPPPPVGVTVRQWQTLLKFDPTRRDGDWGPVTEERSKWVTTAARTKDGRLAGSSADTIRLIQRVIGTPDDGDFGPASRAAMTEWIKRAQTLLSVQRTGNWDTATAAAYARFRNANQHT